MKYYETARSSTTLRPQQPHVLHVQSPAEALGNGQDPKSSACEQSRLSHFHLSSEAKQGALRWFGAS